MGTTYSQASDLVINVLTEFFEDSNRTHSDLNKFAVENGFYEQKLPEYTLIACQALIRRIQPNLSRFCSAVRKEDSKVVADITGQFTNELYNNITLNYGGESFLGWIEDGEAFELQAEEHGIANPDKYVADRYNLSVKVADILDCISDTIEKFSLKAEA